MISSFIKFLGIAAAYYLAARAGLYLQMPSGQASIIWPASGIAIGAVYVFGYRYALATLCGALISSLHFYDIITIKEFTTALCIGSGVALQATVATFLIRKFVGISSTLETAKDIGKIMLLAGPIACCTSASVATYTLLHSGSIQPAETINHIYSWWLGDVFGVLIFTPLIILNLATSHTDQIISFKRKMAVTIPVILVFVVFLILFFNTKQELEEKAYQEYDNKIIALVDEFRKDLALGLFSLHATASFFNASEYVSKKEFELFTMPLLNRSKGLFGISWLPKIHHHDRNRFEKMMREQNNSNFSIMSRAGKGKLIPSPKEDIYFPLAYTEPLEQNKKALGFNVYGHDKVTGDIRKKILDSARDTGKQRATNRFSIVQKEDQYGFIIYAPVYDIVKKRKDVHEFRNDHIGYINGIFVFPKLMAALHKKSKQMKLDIILHDITEQETTFLYDSRTRNFKEDKSLDYTFTQTIHFSKTLNVAGRSWRIAILKNTPLLSNFEITELWVLVNGGIFINALLAAFLMIITARTEIVEKLVAQRTHDLQKANDELEEFAYRTSHDLRSPLVSSIALLDITKGMIEQNETEKAQKSIRLVKDSLQTLETLVKDILALTHLKAEKEEPTEINWNALCKEALKKFDHMENFQRLTITTDFQSQTQLKTLQSRVRLIVENLITNAIKYQDTGKESSFIIIKSYDNAENIVFEIEDNGLGIPKDKEKHLFEMFSRFHPQASYGSGLGLYMMKKSADILGAQITYDHTGTGSRFKLIINNSKGIS